MVLVEKGRRRERGLLKGENFEENMSLKIKMNVYMCASEGRGIYIGFGGIFFLFCVN